MPLGYAKLMDAVETGARPGLGSGFAHAPGGAGHRRRIAALAHAVRRRAEATGAIREAGDGAVALEAVRAQAAENLLRAIAQLDTTHPREGRVAV